MFALAAIWSTGHTASAQEKARLAFIGDSTADGLWGGFSYLTGRDKCLKEALDLGRFARNSTGLARIDFYDWPGNVGRINASYKPHQFIVSIGLNDRQSVVEPGEKRITQWGSPGWAAAYKTQAVALAQNASQTGTGLLWIGLAAMRDRGPDKAAREKNILFAEAVASVGKSNVKYVPPWRLKPDGEDVFASFGPDANGRMVQLRHSDGEHFSTPGDVLVATYLLPKLWENLEASGVKVSPCNLSPR